MIKHKNIWHSSRIGYRHKGTDIYRSDEREVIGSEALPGSAYIEKWTLSVKLHFVLLKQFGNQTPSTPSIHLLVK